MPEIVLEWLRQLPAQLEALLTLDAILQVAVFLLIFPLARLAQRRGWPLVQRLQAWADGQAVFQDFRWLDDLFAIVQAVFQPALAWLLGGAAIALLDGVGRDVGVLRWLVPFLAFWFLQRLLVAWVRSRQTPEQAAVVRQRVIRPLIIVIALLHAGGFLDDVLAAGFRIGDSRITLQATLLGILILYAFSFLARNSRQALGNTVLPRAGVEPSITRILATFVGYAVIIFGVVTALNVIGIPLTTLTVIAGGLSVGVGFGMQEIISNFISGFILLFERSIGPGDVIEIEEHICVVENIGIRATRIKNVDNVDLIVPNNHFLTNTVTNFTRGDRRIRMRVGVGVSYEADPGRVEGALLTAAAHEHVLTEPAPSVQFVDFGPSSLDFVLLVWTDDAMAGPKLRSDLRHQIWRALKEADIEIPFPQRDIHIRTMGPEMAAMPGSSERGA